MSRPIAFIKENGQDIPVYLNPDVPRHNAIQNIIALYRNDSTFEWAVMRCRQVIDGLNMDKDN